MAHQLHEFSELRQKDIFCDAVIRVDDGTEFVVHRVILSACSDYFLALFRNTNNLGNSKNSILATNRSRTAKNQTRAPTGSFKIPGIRAPAMALVLDYIYDAKCSTDPSNMLELLVVGDYLGVLGMVRYCEDYIMSAIDTENCITLMRFGKHRAYPRIFEAAKLFILADFVNLMDVKRSSLLDLPVDQFQELIRDDKLRVKQEDYVWEACLAWMAHQPERRQFLVSLLMSCRLALITPQFFNERVREHPLLRESEPCKSIINDVMKMRAGFEDITTIHLFALYFAHPQPSRIKLGVPRIPHEVIMAIGGWGQGSPQSRIETYDIRANRWNLISCDDPAGPRAYHGMVVLGDKVYCIGGFNGDEYFNGCRVFDASQKRWAEIAPLQTRRCYVSVVELDGEIYALGGYDGQTRLNTCEKYNPGTNQWQAIRSMRCHRSDANACVLNGRIYITGGFNGQECLNSVEYFEPADNAWHMARQMSIRRSGVSCASHQGKIYVMGGFNGLARLKLCERYDPETGEWTAIRDMSFPRSNFAVTVIDDLIFAVGGFNGIQTVSEVEAYDPQTDEWQRVAGMNVVRSALRACIVRGIPNLSEYIFPNRGQLVVGRGNDNGPIGADMEEEEEEEEEDEDTNSIRG